MAAADFSDADFAALLVRLQRLGVLRFEVEGQLTAAAFSIAGEACRDLHGLALTCKSYL